jgi:hypothetical protein
MAANGANTHHRPLSRSERHLIPIMITPTLSSNVIYGTKAGGAALGKFIEETQSQLNTLLLVHNPPLQENRRNILLEREVKLAST